MKLHSFCLLAVVLAAVAPGVHAQGGFGLGQRGAGRGFGGSRYDQLTLAAQKSVQEELKTSDDQATKIKDLMDKRRKEVGSLRGDDRRKKMDELKPAEEAALSGLLKDDQKKRLKQIFLQTQGAAAFQSPEVATALQLTNDQKDKIKSIQDDAAQEVRNMFQGQGRGQGQGRRQRGAGQNMWKKGEEIRKAALDKAVNVLTSDQTTKWKEMTGDPFQGEIRPVFRNGGRGGRGRGGDRDGQPG